MIAALAGVDVFHLALGQFVAKFSETEALIQTTLWELAGVEPPTAQAVFSGIRTDGAMQYINRIAAAQNWPQPRADLALYAFAQLVPINKLRNNILHYGAQLVGPDSWRISNENFVHVPKNISSSVISPASLKQAQADLDEIDLILIDLLLMGRPGDYRAGARPTWQYKQPPQADRRQQNRDKPPKQRHRPRSSGESR